MEIFTLQQTIDERITFLKEQSNQDNKPEVNKTFQLPIEVIPSVDDDIEKGRIHHITKEYSIE
jgi:hypothetical protein